MKKILMITILLATVGVGTQMHGMNYESELGNEEIEALRHKVNSSWSQTQTPPDFMALGIRECGVDKKLDLMLINYNDNKKNGSKIKLIDLIAAINSAIKESPREFKSEPSGKFNLIGDSFSEKMNDNVFNGIRVLSDSIDHLEVRRCHKVGCLSDELTELKKLTIINLTNMNGEDEIQIKSKLRKLIRTIYTKAPYGTVSPDVWLKETCHGESKKVPYNFTETLNENGTINIYLASNQKIIQNLTEEFANNNAKYGEEIAELMKLNANLKNIALRIALTAQSLANATDEVERANLQQQLNGLISDINKI